MSKERSKTFAEAYFEIQKNIAIAMAKLGKNNKDESYKNCPYYNEKGKANA